ncbi:Fatty-acid-binding protein 1-like protein [Drosera capensis]
MTKCSLLLSSLLVFGVLALLLSWWAQPHGFQCVYVDESDVKKYLNEKYRKLAIDVLESTKDFHEGLMESDVSLTIRLQIVYGRLTIGSVRSAFEEPVGSRLRKFGGADTNELLQRFTAQFKDEYKLPKGSCPEYE